MKRRIIIIIVVIIVVALAGFAASQFNLSALNEPGKIETYLATQAKHFLIGRASREGLPPEPVRSPAGVAEGEKFYGSECALCHGLDGHKPTDNGRWMYPRAADLTSPSVQQYSDHELFWILKNGIRLSGMPAFGKVETDQHMWELVRYIRTLKTGKL